jgi:hypothetical protein
LLLFEVIWAALVGEASDGAHHCSVGRVSNQSAQAMWGGMRGTLKDRVVFLAINECRRGRVAIGQLCVDSGSVRSMPEKSPKGEGTRVSA